MKVRPDYLSTFGCTALIAGVLGNWYNRIVELFSAWYRIELHNFKNEKYGTTWVQNSPLKLRYLKLSEFPFHYF